MPRNLKVSRPPKPPRRTKPDAPRLWALSYRLLSSVIASTAPAVEALGIEVKELLLLAEIEAHPYPAELAIALTMPKATVTVYLKRLEAVGLLQREIVPADLRRHRLKVTAAGRATTARGLAALSKAFGERLACLSATEQARLATLLEKLARDPA